MSFGAILGQMLEQGMSGQQNTQRRVGNAASSIASGGQGIEQVLGQLQSALGGMLGGGAPAGAPGGAPAARAGAGAGANPMAGFAEAAKAFLGQQQAGGMTGAQLGGLGAIAGALLGGGGGAAKGAVRGGAMALLGTLALSAIQRAQASKTGQAAPPITEGDVAAVASPEGERVALKAMIAAAKADGQIDQAEMDRILGKLASDDITPEERRFVLDEVKKPLDPAELAAEAKTPAQAAEIYAASLLAIDIDSEAEVAYLRELAAALRLDPAAVAYLHETTGAPRV